MKSLNIGLISLVLASCAATSPAEVHDRYRGIRWNMPKAAIINTMSGTHALVGSYDNIIVFAPKPEYANQYAKRVAFTLRNGLLDPETCAVVEGN